MEASGKQQQQFLIEILSDNNLLSRGVVDLSESICNAETLARLYLEKLLSAATYYSNTTKTNERGKITPDFSLADLGYKEGLKYLCISFTKDVDSAAECARTYKEIVGQYMSYSVPAYVPTVLLILCIATYKPMPEEVCFAQIGCLDLGGPWTERPIVFNYVPQSPAAINASLILKSREFPDGYKFPATLKDPNVSDFDWSKKLNIIIHGFTDNTTTWVRNLASSFIASEDLNVLAVDWSTGADMYYPQSVANARVVAAQVTVFLEYLTETKGEKIGDIHIIGHSLGAHVAGYIGKRVRVKRITALDPAAPLFEGFDTEVRLSEKDAKEVIVLHTNISPLGFGIKDPIGTVDIYVNDGQDQDGCIPMMDMLFAVPTMERLQSMRHNIACSHRRAYELYSEVIFSRHPLKAYPCPLEVALSGVRDSCVSLCEEGDGCLSINKDPPLSTEHKIFYLPTSTSRPFCETYVNVEAKTCAHQKPILQLKLNGGLDQTSSATLHKNPVRESQYIQGLIPVKCGMLHATTIELKLTVDSGESFMTHPEACFSYFEITYVDHNDDLIVLQSEDVRIQADQCTVVHFTNNMFSFFSYRDSVLEYIQKMNVVIPFYNSVDIKRFFYDYVRLPEVLTQSR